MRRAIRSVILFAMILQTVIPGWGKRDGGAPNVIEVRDVPMGKVYYEDKHPPRDCVGMIGRVCFTVQPIAWKGLNDPSKGINLIVNVWGDSASDFDVSKWTQASMTVNIDGNVGTLPASDLVWNEESSFEGRHIALPCESCIRTLAAGKEVWFSVQSDSRVSVKLSERTLESIRAVLAKYDALN